MCSWTTSPFSEGFTTTDASNNNIYDHYNHFTGTVTLLTPGLQLYGLQGGHAHVSTDEHGHTVVHVSVTHKHPHVPYQVVNTRLQGPQGAIGYLSKTRHGQPVLVIYTSDGNRYWFHTSTTTMSNTQYQGSTGYAIDPSSTSLAYVGTNPTPKPKSKPKPKQTTHTRSTYATIEDQYVLKTTLVPFAPTPCSTGYHVSAPPSAPSASPYSSSSSSSSSSDTRPAPPTSHMPFMSNPSYTESSSSSIPLPMVASFAQF